MSNGQGPGGGKPPYDDRTLLDPLSNDELRALREARQRIQAKKSQEGGAVAHQVVFGPDEGDEMGHAPTRAMPSLPSFEGNFSLDQISSPSTPAEDPPTQPAERAGPTPSDPMSELSQADTLAPTLVAQARPEIVVAGRPVAPGPAGGKAVTPAPGHPNTASGPPNAASGRPNATPGHPNATPGHPNVAPGHPNVAPGGPAPTGFGENTLLWMQPPKHTAGPTSSVGNVTADFLPRATPRDVNMGRLKTIGAAAVAVVVVGGLLYSTLLSAPKGMIELRSVPAQAEVYIDGTKYEPTPVRLTLAEGTYTIELKREGYAPATFAANVVGDKTERKTVDLAPLSAPGLMTVRVSVKPVNARITVDGQAYENRRTLFVANMDPAKSHKIVLEAVGFVKIVQDVPANALKNSYSFVLARSSE